jgi:mannitol/fructose-specific phosphotransferase system IIA component
MLNWLWRGPIILFIMVLLHYQNEHIQVLQKQLAETIADQEELQKYQYDCIDQIAKLSSKYRKK